jgi:hypothetical protein
MLLREHGIPGDRAIRQTSPSARGFTGANRDR